jgi:K+-transporting ATPase ATPase C chain
MMASRTPVAHRQLGAGLRALLVLTVIVGLAYPLLLTGVAQVVFPGNADGSMVYRNGKPVGSDLIGQAFTRPEMKAGRARMDKAGDPVMKPDPRYFQSRPSAAGPGYDPLSTAASNLSPDNPVLVRLVEQRRRAAAALDGVPPASVPPDALLASGSGLDPQISPAYAAEQVGRVARVRALPVSRVRALVATHTQGRTLGFLGEPRVNVLELNLALDRMSG